MYEMYLELNISAKEYLYNELDKLYKKKKINEELVKRCNKEINVLYDKSILFVFEYLYKFKLENKNIKFLFKGFINNLYVLYIFGLLDFNPIEYNLPYELFDSNNIEVDLIGVCSYELVWFLDDFNHEFKVIKGAFQEEKIESINEMCNNHYLLLPAYCSNDMTFRLNEFGVFESLEDYRNFKNKYIIVKIGEKNNLDLISNNYEQEICNIIKPQDINDYVKIKSFSHGVRVWKNNQDKLFKQNKISINELISNKEDIYEYLMSHNIDKDTTLEIIKYINRNNKNNMLWKRYVDIMKDHNCEKKFIDILTKMHFIYSRGQSISECLYVMNDKTINN